MISPLQSTGNYELKNFKTRDRDSNEALDVFPNARQCGKSELNNEIMRYTYGDISRVMKKLEQLEEDIKNGKYPTAI